MFNCIIKSISVCHDNLFFLKKREGGLVKIKGIKVIRLKIKEKKENYLVCFLSNHWGMFSCFRVGIVIKDCNYIRKVLLFEKQSLKQKNNYIKQKNKIIIKNLFSLFMEVRNCNSSCQNSIIWMLGSSICSNFSNKVI